MEADEQPDVHPDESCVTDMTESNELSNDCHQSLSASIDIIPSLSPMMNDESQCSNISNLMSGDEKDMNGIATTNGSMNKSINCYCGKERDLNQIELQCARCFKWFHFSCLTSKIGRCLKFLTSYTFLCKFCNPAGVENFSRKQTNFSQMCETAIANLMFASPDALAFSRDKDIIPFIETNWDLLSNMPRRTKQTWHVTVNKTLLKESETFICDNRDPNDPVFTLRCRDLLKIGPNYENTIGKIGGSSGKSVEVGRGGFGRWSKRKPGGLSTLEGSEYLISKKVKSDLSHPKLPLNGFPLEYPFNKDGYRYILAEPDPHAPCRQEFEECQDWAGKPIPGWLCRKLMPDRLAIAMHDRAPQLKISEDRMSVTGERGYCMLRSSHGVTRGSWYCEITIDDMSDNSATRVGWSQELANLQAPLGYDKFGYSWRSRKGTKFHESKGYHFSDEGYKQGDVIGMLIVLPHPTITSPSQPLESSKLTKESFTSKSEEFLPPTFKDKPLVKFKSYFYFEEKDEPNKVVKTLKPLVGSKIIYFKNGKLIGTAFEDINAGIYYPAISLYKSCTASFNFGPKFKFPPQDIEYRKMSDLLEEAQVEQTMSDVLYFAENDGKLRLDTFYGIT